MPFYVSRQKYYYSGGRWVEVAKGGLDYAGPDMLVPKYKHLGEGQEYTDPREAVEAAVLIARAWRKDSKGQVKLTAKGEIAGEMGIEGEQLTIPRLQEWGDKQWEHLEKCDRCGEPLPKKVYSLTDFVGDKFCSERCAELAFDEMLSQEEVG